MPSQLNTLNARPHRARKTPHATALKTAAALPVLRGPMAAPTGLLPKPAPLYDCQTLFTGCLELEHEVRMRSEFSSYRSATSWPPRL